MRSPLITGINRREAMRRSRLYRDDFREWTRLRQAMKDALAGKRSTNTSGDEEKQLKFLELGLKRRWKCKHPFPVPIEPERVQPHESDERHALASPDEKVRIVKLEPMKLSEPLSPLWTKGFLGHDPFIFMFDHKSVRRGILKPSSGTGKHLCLIVDLSIPLEALTKEIKRQVGKYRGFYRSLHPGRNKPNREVGDIWAIYDAVQKVKSISNVASLFAQKKRADLSVANPSKAANSAVRRAFSKAKQFIQQVEQEASI